MTLGKKRNVLNSKASGSILVYMDDDDYYHPDRVHHVVQKFIQNPLIQLAGSSEIFMFYTDIQEIYKFGPYNKNHCTNGTMAYRRAYGKTHLYDETVTHAEERSFLENYRNPMIQLDSQATILHIVHGENTFQDKKKIGLLEPTNLSKNDFQ
jgi:glycosyltransferase involved in cell wall biosynthesis